MKTRLWIIIPIVLLGITTVILTNSYDFAPSTKLDPYDLDARLLYVHNISHSCITQPCSQFDSFVFGVASQKPVQIVGANICGGIYCIKDIGAISYNLPTNHTISDEDFGGGSLGSIPWNVGDTVNIRVKVKQAHILENGDVVFDEKVDFIDLGQSMIKEVYRK